MIGRFVFYCAVVFAGFWGYWIAAVLHSIMDSTAP